MHVRVPPLVLHVPVEFLIIGLAGKGDACFAPVVLPCRPASELGAAGIVERSLSGKIMEIGDYGAVFFLCYLVRIGLHGITAGRSVSSVNASFPPVQEILLDFQVQHGHQFAVVHSRKPGKVRLPFIGAHLVYHLGWDVLQAG